MIYIILIANNKYIVIPRNHVTAGTTVKHSKTSRSATSYRSEKVKSIRLENHIISFYLPEKHQNTKTYNIALHI